MSLKPTGAVSGLPAPSGPHAVGRTALDLVDEGREDPFARGPGVPRRLAVWVWYPALRRQADSAPTAYLPGAWRASSWMWGLRSGRVRPHASQAAPPAPTDGRFPLVAFSPSANPPLLYAALLEELASHGYVVAGVSHTYEVLPLSVFVRAWPRLARLRSTGGALAAPGKRPYEIDLRQRAKIVAVKADDLRFVLDRIAFPQVDRSRMAVIGHSFGGGAAAEVCQRPHAPLAGVSLDGGLWREPESLSRTVPFLQLFAEHPEYVCSPEEARRRGFVQNARYAEQDRATTLGAWQALHEAARPGHSARVRGASHTSFCDWPMLPLRRWSPARRALNGVSGKAIANAVSGAVLAFLDRHLHHSTGDVNARLEAHPGLLTGSPSELFPYEIGRPP